MKEYIKSNQAAWELAYEKALDEYKNYEKTLTQHPGKYISKFLSDHLDEKDINNKHIGQLMCNNGREILALGMKYKAASITGFDIAKNMVDAANNVSKKLNLNALFHQGNVLDIPITFNHAFDTLFIQIGAIVWIEDLKALFQVVYRLLKPGGTFYLLDGHPMTHMFATISEDNFDSNNPYNLANSYFSNKPFEEKGGIYYMTLKNYESPLLTSFPYTFEKVMSSLLESGFIIKGFYESADNLLEIFPELDQKGIPLVFLIKSKK